MKVILTRRKSQEERNVPLWFEDKSRKFIVSVVGSQGDTRMRIVSPNGRKEIGFVAADFSNVQRNSKSYARAAERELREMGFDAKLRE